jgi:Domain of unknown function (DU1801)
MAASATPVDEYLAGLPEDRREAMAAVRKVILKNLPAGYEETILQYGSISFISYIVPFSVLAKTYNKQPLGYAALGSHKSTMSLYLNNVYGDPKTAEWFKAAYAASGKKLNMGKSCVNFKRLSDLPLDVIGQTIARTPMDEFVSTYVAARSSGAIGSGNRKGRLSPTANQSGGK